MQKTIIFIIFIKSDPNFQDLSIVVNAKNPKTYFIEKAQLQGLVDQYYCQYSHFTHDLI